MAFEEILSFNVKICYFIAFSLYTYLVVKLPDLPAPWVMRGKMTPKHFYLDKSLIVSLVRKIFCQVLKNAHSPWIYDKQISINNASYEILF